jgi:hypothetical protein
MVRFMHKLMWILKEKKVTKKERGNSNSILMIINEYKSKGRSMNILPNTFTLAASLTLYFKALTRIN